MNSVSEDERIWAFIAWLLNIVGAIIGLVLRPGSKYVRYWSYLSIAFFILLIITWVITFIIGFIPFIGFIINILIYLGIVIAYIIGLIKVLTIQWWKPPIIYNIAQILGIERI
jgi:uncharacterized membrane protein